jgi:hypothetical protein
MVPNLPKELQASRHTPIRLAEAKECNISVFPGPKKNDNLNDRIKQTALIIALTKPN